MSPGIFKNLRIIELSSVLAGPLTGTFFAELGANVIKIENRKTNGDITRTWKSPNETTPDHFSAYYASANYGKKAVLADLSDYKELLQLYDSIEKTDIVIVNFKPGDAQKLKLDYAALQKINPKLIYAEITGFGSDDARTAYDAVLQAETGFMSMNGAPGSPSTKMPVAMIDMLAAHQLKEGILTALLMKVQTGKGCKVGVSLYDAAIGSLANQASNWLMNGEIPQKMGSAHPNIAPYGDVFITKDQLEILFAIGSDRHFKILCEILETPLTATDKKFEHNLQRVENRAELNKILQEKISGWKRDDLYFSLIHEQVPVACIRDLKEVFENERTGGLILEENKDGVVSRRVRTVVFKIEKAEER